MTSIGFDKPTTFLSLDRSGSSQTGFGCEGTIPPG